MHRPVITAMIDYSSNLPHTRFPRLHIHPTFNSCSAIGWNEKSKHAYKTASVQWLRVQAGILQPLADFIKLLTKEDIEPRDAKKRVFRFAPLVAFAIMVFAICFLPIDGASVLSYGANIGGFSGDLIVILAFATIANFLLFLAGWASCNPYGTIGSARVLTQFLGYDIPLFLMALTPAFIAGSLQIANIASTQAGTFLPFILLAPWAFRTIHNHYAG